MLQESADLVEPIQILPVWDRASTLPGSSYSRKREAKRSLQNQSQRTSRESYVLAELWAAVAAIFPWQPGSMRAVLELVEYVSCQPSVAAAESSAQLTVKRGSPAGNVRQVPSNGSTESHSCSETDKNKSLIECPISHFEQVACDDCADRANPSPSHARDESRASKGWQRPC